jgi:antitoxin (DNA-binding transcriptional repressor) of toxin-antitoxin stability system
MKTVVMTRFRTDAARILRRIAKGERFILSYRGCSVAILEPISAHPRRPSDDPPFLGIGRRAVASPKGKTRHEEIDRILYGRT